MKKLLLLLLSFTISSSATAYASVSELIYENDAAEKTVINNNAAYNLETEITKHDRAQKDEVLFGEGAEDLPPDGSDNTIALMSAEASGDCGANLTWELNDAGTLIISGTGPMYTFNYNDMPWYGMQKNINKVIIDSGVTNISDYAFYSCENLTDIDIPEGVISIGRYAFNNCGLTSVSVPSTVKSISNSAFNACDELKEVHITDLTAWCNISFSERLSNPLSYAGNLYLDNRLITELTIPSDITKINNYAFNGCTSIKQVNLHDSVTSIGAGAFSRCTSLTSIEIPSSVTSIGVSSYGGAFEYCTGLTGVYITDLTAYCNISFSGENPLSYAKNLYINNELVTDIVIPNGVTSIGAYAFEGCQSVESVTIPSTVISIGNYAFSECDKLSKVNIPNSVTTVGRYAFSYCNRLTNIILDNGITSISDGMFYACTSLKRINLPNTLTSIGDRAFLGCSDLQSINIPAKVTAIGDYVFSDCTNLAAIDVASGNSAYSSQNGVLFNKNKTELVYYPMGKKGGYVIPDGVINICHYAFYYSNLTEIKIPDSVTNIGEWAFGYCTKLSVVDIPASVTSISCC